MCQWFGPIISDKPAGLDLTRKHLRSDTQENFQYLTVVSPKFVTVQSDMQDQDYGMNYHNIYGVQIH